MAYSASGYFNGDIASVGLYTTAKTQAEAQAIYAEGIAGDESTNSGIFAYYKLDTASTSSGAIKDLVGTNHGTVNGNPSLGSYYKDGNYLINPVEDTKNAVIDVSNPVLGTEVNTLANALSPSNETDATTGLTSTGSISSVSSPTYSGNFSIKFETDANAENMNFSSNFTVENAKLYKLSITFFLTSGVFKVISFKFFLIVSDAISVPVIPKDLYLLNCCVSSLLFNPNNLSTTNLDASKAPPLIGDIPLLVINTTLPKTFLA